MGLQRQRVLFDELRIQKGNRGFLQRIVRAAVHERSDAPEDVDAVLRTDDPTHAEAGKAPVLGEAVDLCRRRREK